MTQHTPPPLPGPPLSTSTSTGMTSTAVTAVTPPPPIRSCSPRGEPHAGTGSGPGLRRRRQRPRPRRARLARDRRGPLPRAIASTKATACARSLDDRIELTVADSATWHPETTYDFALSSYALPPRGPGRAATLATLATALAPGGILVLGEWDEEACAWGRPGTWSRSRS